MDRRITIQTEYMEDPYVLAQSAGRALFKTAKVIRDSPPETRVHIGGADWEMYFTAGKDDPSTVFDRLLTATLNNYTDPHHETVSELDEICRQLSQVDPRTAPKLLFDVDGVAADFDLHYYRTFGTHYLLDGMEKMWDNIDRAENYYGRQPVFLHFEKLFQAVKHLETAFLTSCRLRYHAECKLDWMRRSFGPRTSILPILPDEDGKFDKNKEFVKHSVLVDDYDLNVNRWRSLGAHAISHSCVLQTARELHSILVTHNG